MNIEVSDIALKIGTKLNNKYIVNEVHYLGTFGIVYFGERISDKKQVAIKEFIPYKMANRDMDGVSVICKSPGMKESYKNTKKSFEQECIIVKKLLGISALYKKYIIKYVEHFYENETIYLITEKIDGRSLQEYIENGEDYSIRKTAKSLVKAVRQVHKMGVIHCDIKPSNILIDKNGEVVLIDFGSACDIKNKKFHQAFVSRGYSAPELYYGEDVDFRTDIYSIGAVLYYMLTDYQLPSADDYDEQEEIPKISEFIEISPYLEKVILKTLNKNKRNRPKSMLLLQIILKV